MLAESPIELPEVGLNPVQPRFEPVHATPKAAFQAIKGPLVEEHPHQDRQSRQADHDVELHIVHISSVHLNQLVV